MSEIKVQTGSIGGNKRIASNTMFLFLRMLILTVINLYTVRLVIKGLGIEDYGIFNTVAGIVTLASFFSSVLEVSIQRFYSYYMGRNETEVLQNIFSVSLKSIFILSAIIIILCETIGLYFIYAQLNIPIGKQSIAVIAFQFSLFAFILSLLQIPYTAAIFAHEDIGIYAIVSLISCMMNLLIAFIITVQPLEGLVFYSGGLAFANIVICLIYAIIGQRKYKECHYSSINNLKLQKSILFFSGWTTLGSIAKIGMVQGSIILLNIYFGAVTVAAFAISNQIQNAFNSLCGNIVLASRPAMIKAYAEKQFDYLNQLFNISNKLIFYILLMVSLPLIMEMDTILLLWLGERTEEFISFSRLAIVFILILSLNNPISIIMQGIGRIKEYTLTVETTTILCLPITWLLFHLGLPAVSVFYCMIGICIIAHVLRLLCLNYYYKSFSIKEYLSAFIVPASVIIVVAGLLVYGLHSAINHIYWRLIINLIIAPLVICLLIYIIGLNKAEQGLIRKLIRRDL